MKKTDRRVEEFIRVDHAGERGAVKIYEGQLLALNTIVKNDNLKKIIEDMKEHEVEHCQFFENEIKKRNIEPTKFLPLWDLLGVGLGFGSTILGKKAAMLCTASVEEVIDKHYQDQINQLGPEEKNLKIVGINYKDQLSDAISYLEDNGDPYDNSIFDLGGDYSLKLGVIGAPETFLVIDGKIVSHRVGELNRKIWERDFESFF